MSCRVIYALLRDSPDVVNRVAARIFQDNAPQGMKGECIILRELSGGSVEYHLQAESDCANPSIQVDFYAKSAALAESGYQLVRNRLSGYSGVVTVLDASDEEQSVTVSEITIQRRGALVDEPRDGSDQWSYRFSADFSVFHSQSVPSLT